MDSANNRDKNPDGQGWEDPAFDWGNMKDGIFGRILEEDPLFFEEKRKRRLAFWLWSGAALLLVGGIGFWLLASPEMTVHSPLPVVAPAKEKAIENRPVANGPALPVEEKTPIRNAPNIDQTVSSDQADKGFPSVNAKPSDSVVAAHKGHIHSRNPVGNADDNAGQAPPFPPTEMDVLPARATSPTPSLLANLIHLLTVGPPVPMLVIAPATNGQSNQTAEGYDKNENKHQGRWAMAATGGAVFSSSKYTGNSPAVGLRNDHNSPFFGYRSGIEVKAPLSQKSNLRFGLSGEVVYQNIDIYTERQVEVFKENALFQITHYIVGGRTLEVYGDTTVIGTERNRLVKYNEFKSVAAHAGYAHVFAIQNWNLSPSIGMVAGLLAHQAGMTVAGDKSIFAFDNSHRLYQRLQLKTSVGLEVERRLAGQLSLLFQYRFDKQWNNASTEAGLALRPANHYFSVGVSRKW